MGWGRCWGAALVGLLWASTFVAPVGNANANATANAASAGNDPWIVERPRFEPLDGSPLTVEGHGDYRGAFELNRNTNAGGIAVINHVGLDDYMRGISEVPAAWPIEAQKAQAIAARTYALYEATRKTNAAYKNAGADICATDSCQVYRGLAKERQPQSEAWNHAVAQTRNQVLLYKGGPIVAKYSSSNGGHTVGGGQPYLRATPDPDDAYSPLHQWRASYPAAEVALIAGLSAAPAELHREDQEIVATYIDPDGNPVQQRILTADFRNRLNNGIATPPGLPLPVPSIRFDVHTAGGIIHIDGRGWGHGIGLSQYGALGKALRGLKAPEILAAYYAGLRPTAVPAEGMPAHVRVALALDQSAVAIANAGGRFRVVDADGTVIAHSATGTWHAAPAESGRVRLEPPDDQRTPPTASIAATQPAHPVPGQPLAVTVQLDGPAAVTAIDLVRPGGGAEALDGPKLRTPGPLQIRLGTADAGTYRLDFRRDGGAGTGPEHTTSLTIDVPTNGGATGAHDGQGADGAESAAGIGPAGAATATTTASGHLLPPAVLQTIASLMLVAVVGLGAVWVGRRPAPELH